MSLLPNNKGPQEKRPSPAVTLAKFYEKALVNGSGLSNASDFTKLLKTNGFEDIRKVIAWLSQQPEHMRTKPSSWFVYKFKWLKVESANDLADYPVGPDVGRLGRKIIDEGGSYIPNEFIQHALDYYGAFLEWLRQREDGKLLYERMDPPNEFVVKWFGLYCASYSRAYRKFTVRHEMFRRYAYRIADSCSSRRVMDRLLREYEDA